MVLRQCPKGHPYDESKYSSCPICSGATMMGQSVSLRNDEIGKTEPLNPVGDVKFDIPATMPLMDDSIGATVVLEGNGKPADDKKAVVKPVYGWLVVVEGEHTGLDFRIHTALNKIGRAEENDIAVYFDNSISSTNDCYIRYDNKTNAFYLQAGEGKNNIYVNDEILLAPVKIKDNDIIEIGSTKFVFRALCNESFRYNN